MASGSQRHYFIVAHINIEFKARLANADEAESRLLKLNPTFIGEDHQIDTYFQVPKGRLKLREGNIENALIFYERENLAAQKQSNVILYKHNPDENLKSILERLRGVKVIVDKIRKIYFIENVKIHFDRIETLGTFIEVEAIESEKIRNIDNLQKQCDYFAQFFNISDEDYEKYSYSDLMLAINT